VQSRARVGRDNKSAAMRNGERFVFKEVETPAKRPAGKPGNEGGLEKKELYGGESRIDKKKKKHAAKSSERLE